MILKRYNHNKMEACSEIHGQIPSDGINRCESSELVILMNEGVRKRYTRSIIHHYQNDNDDDLLRNVLVNTEPVENQKLNP
jgi:hypothetical protein